MTRQALKVLTEELYNEYQKALGIDNKPWAGLTAEQKANVAHTILQVVATRHQTATFNDSFSNFVNTYLTEKAKKAVGEKGDPEEVEFDIVGDPEPKAEPVAKVAKTPAPPPEAPKVVKVEVPEPAAKPVDKNKKA
jgi:hypothetical protein